MGMLYFGESIFPPVAILQDEYVGIPDFDWHPQFFLQMVPDHFNTDIGI
jgi:hypothetical protein